MFSCRDYAELASQSLDLPLTFRQRVRLRIHLWLCSPCRRFRDHAIYLRAALRRRPVSAPAPESDACARLSETARERIRRALMDNGVSGDGA